VTQGNLRASANLFDKSMNPMLNRTLDSKAQPNLGQSSFDLELASSSEKNPKNQ